MITKRDFMQAYGYKTYVQVAKMNKPKKSHPWRAWNPGSLKSSNSDHVIPDHIAASVNHDASRTRVANRSRLGAGFGRGGYLK